MCAGGNGGDGADRLHGGQVQVPSQGLPERLDQTTVNTCRLEISEERSHLLDVIYLERNLLKRVILLIVSEPSEKVVRFNFLMNE